jgi:hypothetical protein
VPGEDGAAGVDPHRADVRPKMNVQRIAESRLVRRKRASAETINETSGIRQRFFSNSSNAAGGVGGLELPLQRARLLRQ